MRGRTRRGGPVGRRASIGVQMAVAFSAATACAALLVGVTVVSEFHTARSGSIARLAADATAQAEEIRAGNDALPAMLQPGMSSLRPRACAAEVDALATLAPRAREAVLRPDGTVVCSAGGWTHLQTGGWLARAVRFGIAGPVRPEGSSIYYVAYARRFVAGKGRGGALVMLQPSRGDILTHDRPDVTTLVVDAPSGEVLDSSTTQAPARLPAGLMHQLISDHSVTTSKAGGGRLIYAPAPVEGTSWLVLAGMRESRALAPAVRSLQRNVVLGVLLVLVVLALGWVVTRKLARPLRQLRGALDLVMLDNHGVDHGTGRGVVRTTRAHRLPETGPRELADLGRALNAMIEGRRRIESRLASLVRQSSDLVLIVDREGVIRYATPSLRLLAGRDAAAVRGTQFLDLVDDSDRAKVSSRLIGWLRGDFTSVDRAEIRLRGDAGARDVEARVQNLLHDPAVSGLVITCHDITGRKAGEAKLARAATHDALTGLPNRVLVLDRLGQMLARGSRTGHGCGVLFLDLDRFKLVNDTSGHATGDALLSAVARRLAAVLRPGDTLGRFGGDEFIVVCDDVSGPGEALHIAQRLLDEMDPPFLIDGQELFVSMSVGIALARPGDEPGALLRDADAALYRAKDSGRARAAVFDDGMRESSQRRLDVGNRLQRALETNSLFLEFQPILSLTDGDMAGVEVLLRWRRDGVVVLPDAFVPVAEETGAILPIGQWVFHETCRQLNDWKASHQLPAGFRAAVNVSARQLTAPGFADAVAGALADSGVDPARLVVEVTESVLMKDGAAAAVALDELRALGVSVSIDDFGTGFSSLGRLETLPVDELKIDRSFVARLDQGDRAHAIVHSVIHLGHAVGLRVVAEGVEKPAQHSTLREMGCDHGQGFLFERPRSPEVIAGYLGGRPSQAGVALVADQPPPSPAETARPTASR